ncbi:MAG TPA: sigma 54-interacting transcriptional regulator [Thermoanaerobaculia bacterium]|jgi:DNA-binding NtrC family response regulator|nr:sigma 54-interacting transcriptional regulator [Thermoanaerobaculia bacterium]
MTDTELAAEISALVYVNPFLEKRIEHERRILGDAYIPSQPFWSLEPDLRRKSNIDLIAETCAALVTRLWKHDGPPANRAFEDVAVYFLYERYRDSILELIQHGQPGQRVAFYSAFKNDVIRYLGDTADAAHLFACFFQVRRAFHHIFRNIIGRSLPAARLRATVWQSIFTHDMRRFRRSVYARMGDVPTLITGPTGTGKELVARAIGLSRYAPFDERRERFTGDPESTFVSLNPSALSPTLIESELFGHRKGAFTGAIADHEGFLESTGALGTVFLDEIGELDSSMQVKLLRVLQTRTFQRLGDTTPRRFEGKIVAATNRDLAAEIRAGRFREDFFYRLCADTVVTPGLHEQLADDDELTHLLRFISARVAGEQEAEELSAEVVKAIDRSPGRGYRWPGNFRELEQCVRSVMLRGSYEPSSNATTGDARRRIADNVVAGAFTADDLLRNYCTLLYAKTRNYSQVAEKLGVDRRTVRAKVDVRLLEEL